MKILTSLLGVALFAHASLSPATAAIVDFPEYGFTIDALDAPPSDTTPTSALMTFLPATEGFAPNINVSIQPYGGNIASYIALSKDQFKKMNCTVVADKQNGEKEWRVEYTGPMQGKDLHFYARAIAHNGKVYLVTATATRTQWEGVAERLRKSVDGFKTK